MNAKRVLKALDQVIAELPGGGELRDGQRQMTEAVADAIATGRHLVVRAGTGTGKSLAYLVPAVLARKRLSSRLQPSLCSTSSGTRTFRVFSQPGSQILILQY